MLRYRVGVASDGGSHSLARYYNSETLKVGEQELARYYAGEVMPHDQVADLGQAIAAGDVGFAEAVDELMQAYVTVGKQPDELDQHELDLQDRLTAATARAKVELEIADAGGLVGRLRPDMPAEVANKLGIDRSRPTTQRELAHLLNGTRADNGKRIEGKQIQAPMVPLTAVFGLDDSMKPTAAQVDNVLNGLRVDGAEPVAASGDAFRDGVVAGARKRFLAIYGGKDDATAEQIAFIRDGKTVEGKAINDSDYARKVNATKSPVAYTELLWSSDKNLSIAWGLAETEAERGMLLDVQRIAVDKTMQYVEREMGYARRGKEGSAGVVQGKLGWVIIDHYTARPVAEISQRGANGEEHTEFEAVPTPKMGAPDMHLHAHVIVPNVIVLPDGKCGSIDGDALEGRVKEFGAIFQAYEADELKKLRVKVALDEATGAARIQTIPDDTREHYSKRSLDGEKAARDYAASKGRSWDEMSDDARLKLLRAGHAETRHRKTQHDSSDDFTAWRKQAADRGYQHKSVLNTAPIEPEVSVQEKRRLSHERSLPMVEALFQRKAKIGGQDLREIAARGMIDGGISDNPGEDIAVITKAYRTHGVVQDGVITPILWAKEMGPRGKEKVVVTTGRHEDIERDLVRLAKAAYADRSTVIPLEVLDRHVAKFLADNPKIDTADPHWIKQRAGLYEIGTGGKLSGFIGAAGAGKTTVLSAVVSASQEQGKTVYGIAMANAHTAGLRTVGVKDEHRASMRAFQHRVKTGRYKLDEKSVVIIDEFGRVGSKDFLALMTLREKHGFEIKFTGDPQQCQSLEAPVFGVLTKAFPEGTFPEVDTTRRMASERNQDIATLLRAGDAAQAIAMKREDGTIKIVAGGRVATIDAVARIWREKTEQNAGRDGYSLTISAPTNIDAHDISVAVRKHMRDMGRLGHREIKLPAIDGQERDRATLTLSEGDRVRLFDKINLAKGHVLGNNSEVVTVVSFAADGFVARNDKGQEGLIRYDKITSKDGKAVRLGYGYSRTIDSVQSVTSTDHINAFPSGSASVDTFKGYTGDSRAVEDSIMVINEAAERLQITRALPNGAPRPPINHDAILANVATNLSRSPEKATALDFIEHAKDLQRGTAIDFRAIMEPAERSEKQHRNNPQQGPRRYKMERLAAEMAPALRKVMDRAQEIAHKLSHAINPNHPTVSQSRRDHAYATSTTPQHDQSDVQRHQEQTQRRGLGLSM